jgi:predicted nucleic acid-binding protein
MLRSRRSRFEYFAWPLAEHPQHLLAREFAANRSDEGFALAPQVLAEFVHVSTDPRRFEKPLIDESALAVAEKWRLSREIKVVFATMETVELLLGWMREFALGRKRILDTLLAATYLTSEVHSIVTLDARDFARFPAFAPIALR